jgi:hypothetical protein
MTILKVENYFLDYRELTTYQKLEMLFCFHQTICTLIRPK